MIGTGPDLDDEVSLPSCSTDGEGSDNGESCGSDARTSSDPLVIGTGPDLDDEVSLPFCSTDGEGSDDGGSCRNDMDCFSTITLEGPNDAREEGPAGFEAVEGMELGCGGSSEGLELVGLGQIVEDDVVNPANCPKPPKGRSIVHNRFNDGSAVFLLFDIEIGGEFAGIIQLSAELVRMKLAAGKGVAQDQVEEMARVATFDSYVKPECDKRCIDIHQIHPDDERIVGAHNIDQVWVQFKKMAEPSCRHQ